MRLEGFLAFGSLECFDLGMCIWKRYTRVLCQAAVAEAIRKAMNRHPTDADIAQHGPQALARLAHGADEGAQEVGSESGLRSSLPLLV